MTLHSFSGTDLGLAKDIRVRARGKEPDHTELIHLAEIRYSAVGG